MSKGFIDRVYELAPNYTVKLEVSYITTKLQITSAKKPGLTKTSVFRLTDLSETEDMDRVCLEELEELLEVIQAEE